MTLCDLIDRLHTLFASDEDDLFDMTRLRSLLRRDGDDLLQIGD